MLRQLVDEYFDHRLGRVEYLAQRRSLLDRIDHEFNGDVNTNGWHEPDFSQPNDTTSPNTIVRSPDEGTGGES